MADLSPAAQAALDHFLADVEISLEYGIAAALRAAADCIEAESIWRGHAEHTGVRWSAHKLRQVAAELEGSHD